MIDTNLNFNAFSESAKALAELILGSSKMDNLVNNVNTFSVLQEQNKELRNKVALLSETSAFKDKYENLKREFQKVAAERDSLSAQAFRVTQIECELSACKEAYQQQKAQLAAYVENTENQKSSVSAYSALECIYQSYKSECEKYGFDIKRIPAVVDIQLYLDNNENNCFLSYRFYRKSAKDWTLLGISQ